ncbi:MAG: response regulator, partial [Polyangiaceae bacterium]
SVGELVGCRDQDLFESTTTDAYLPTLNRVATSKQRALTGAVLLQPRMPGVQVMASAITFTPVLDQHQQVECIIASATERPATAPSPVDAALGSNSLHAAVAGFAHDINNLLTVVATYQTFIAEGPLSAQQASDLKSAVEATQAGGALADRLLLLSKGQRGPSALVDVNDVVGSTAKLLRPILGDAITLSIELADVPLLVRAGTGELEQVIVNLAFNSRDAMLSGPLELHVSSTILAAGEALSRGLSPGNYALISVKDSGPGIDSATIARIFEPFFTTKARCGGTGLGLFMVKEVVTRLGGAVQVETAVGQGTEFCVYLPVAPALQAPPPRSDADLAASAQSPSSRPQPRSASSNRPVSLIVDDNDAFRESLGRVLSECDMQPLLAKNGLQALQILDQQQVDVVIADQILPGMDGLSLLDTVRTRWPHCQRVLLTGYASPDVVIAAVNRCGVSKVLIKSMHPILIRDEIERVCLEVPRLHRVNSGR